MIIAEWIIVIAGIISIITFCMMMYKSIAAEEGSTSSKILISLAAIFMTIGGLALTIPTAQAPSAVKYYGQTTLHVLTGIGTVISIGIILFIVRRRSNDSEQIDSVRGEGLDWYSWIRLQILEANIGIAILTIIGIIVSIGFIYNLLVP